MLDKIVPDPPNTLFTVNKSVSLEDALNYASDLLRCIITTAYESGDNTQGTSRIWRSRCCTWPRWPKPWWTAR